MTDKNQILEEASRLGVRPYSLRPSANKPSSLNKPKPKPKPEPKPQPKNDDRLLLKKLYNMTTPEVDRLLAHRDKYNPKRIFDKEEIQETIATNANLYDYPAD